MWKNQEIWFWTYYQVLMSKAVKSVSGSKVWGSEEISYLERSAQEGL